MNAPRTGCSTLTKISRGAHARVARTAPWCRSPPPPAPRRARASSSPRTCPCRRHHACTITSTSATWSARGCGVAKRGSSLQVLAADDREQALPLVVAGARRVHVAVVVGTAALAAIHLARGGAGICSDCPARQGALSRACAAYAIRPKLMTASCIDDLDPLADVGRGALVQGAQDADRAVQTRRRYRRRGARLQRPAGPSPVMTCRRPPPARSGRRPGSSRTGRPARSP